MYTDNPWRTLLRSHTIYADARDFILLHSLDELRKWKLHL